MKFFVISIFAFLLTCSQKGTESSAVEKTDINSVEKNVTETKEAPVPEREISVPEKSVEAIKETNPVQANNENPQREASQKTIIQFEDMNHYLFSLTGEEFLLINDQKKMDDIYRVIHQKSGGGRMAPIPTVNDGESYLIFKPRLKSTNDIEITAVYLNNNTLNVDVKPFSDPQRNVTSRVTPNVLIKLLSRVNAKKIKINYNN